MNARTRTIVLCCLSSAATLSIAAALGVGRAPGDPLVLRAEAQAEVERVRAELEHWSGAAEAADRQAHHFARESSADGRMAPADQARFDRLGELALIAAVREQELAAELALARWHAERLAGPTP